VARREGEEAVVRERPEKVFGYLGPPDKPVFPPLDGFLIYGRQLSMREAEEGVEALVKLLKERSKKDG
jgi:hypothetical protein